MEVKYESNTPANSEQMRKIMEDDLFICAGNESHDGRPVLALRYKYFNPRKYSALDAARAFAFIVEWMSRMYPKAQTHGIVVVEDVAGFSFKSFDLRLISFLENSFTKTLPHVTNPGFFIKVMLHYLPTFLVTSSRREFDCLAREKMTSLSSIFRRIKILCIWGLVALPSGRKMIEDV